MHDFIAYYSIVCDVLALNTYKISFDYKKWPFSRTKFKFDKVDLGLLLLLDILVILTPSTGSGTLNVKGLGKPPKLSPSSENIIAVLSLATLLDL